MEAITYVRFSSAEQRKGSSKARQTRDLEAFCAEQGWPIVERLMDEGVSAWSGAHRATGSFGRIEREILNGEHVGRVLVVEHLDRLSRLDPDSTFDLVRAIIRAGTAILTLNDRTLYEAGARLDMLSIMRVLIASEQAHEASQNKSARLRASYAERRRQAAETGKAITSWAPAWLRKAGDRFEPIPDRVRLLREIFDLADSGLGARAICLRLNARDEPVWSTERSREPQGWHFSRITRLIRDRAVLGELQPCEKVAGKRVPIGSPIGAYYPTAIDAALFARVNDAAPARKAVRGRRSGQLHNLVSGLTRCGVCDGPFRYRMVARAGSVRTSKGRAYVRHGDESYLLCDSHYRKTGCLNSKRILYPRFEAAILDAALGYALDDSNFASEGEVGRIRTEIAEAKRALELDTEQAANLWRAFGESGSAMAMKLAGEAEERAKVSKERLNTLDRDLQAARGVVDAQAHLARVADVRATLTAVDDGLRYQARAKVAAALTSVVGKIECRPDGSAFVAFKESVRAIVIRSDFTVWDFDLKHPGRPHETNDPAVRAYLRRSPT